MAKKPLTLGGEGSPKNFPAKLISGLAAVLFVIAVGSAVFFFIQYRNTQQILKNPDARAQKELQSVIEKVGKLMLLPTGESPTLATVSDATKLKDQPFFQKAENGDKVLIYSKAKKAILYRPSTNKIIDVAPVNIDAMKAAQATQATPTPNPEDPVEKSKPYTLAIYNGTTTSGLAGQAEQKIKDAGIQAVVKDKKDAAKSDYTKNIIVNIGNISVIRLEELKRVLSADIETALPTGEKKPDADVLVILGAGAAATGTPAPESPTPTTTP